MLFADAGYLLVSGAWPNCPQPRVASAMHRRATMSQPICAPAVSQPTNWYTAYWRAAVSP